MGILWGFIAAMSITGGVVPPNAGGSAGSSYQGYLTKVYLVSNTTRSRSILLLPCTKDDSGKYTIDEIESGLFDGPISSGDYRICEGFSVYLRNSDIAAGYAIDHLTLLRDQIEIPEIVTATPPQFVSMAGAKIDTAGAPFESYTLHRFSGKSYKFRLPGPKAEAPCTNCSILAVFKSPLSEKPQTFCSTPFTKYIDDSFGCGGVLVTNGGDGAGGTGEPATFQNSTADNPAPIDPNANTLSAEAESKGPCSLSTVPSNLPLALAFAIFGAFIFFYLGLRARGKSCKFN